MNQLNFNLEESNNPQAADRVTKYQSHSGTSIAAAQAIEKNAGTLRGLVYRRLVRLGSFGATDEEIQLGLDLNPSTQRPRRVELVEKGWLSIQG